MATKVRYRRTSESADVLVLQCAIRLLKGESYVSVESSLDARGIGNVTKIMDRAEELCRC